MATRTNEQLVHNVNSERGREGEVCHGRKPLLTKIKTRPAKASSLFKLATASTNPCANIACGNVSCVASEAGAIAIG